MGIRGKKKLYHLHLLCGAILSEFVKKFSSNVIVLSLSKKKPFEGEER
jgi:hypothetical protein